MIAFNKYYNQFNILSISLVVVSLFFLIFKGLNFGIDFKGGTLIELRSTDDKINVSSLRNNLNSMNLGDVSVKNFGNETDFLIKFEINNNKNIIEEIKVNLDKFISSCKNNVDTVIGENGSRISGGQIQRIGIARAIYSNAEILIFDESTSSLDPDSEKKFLETINLFKNKKTIIIISHKLSTLSICNKKFLLKNNQLIKADDISTN